MEWMPVIRGKDLERINALFQPFVFYETLRSGDRRCVCTACNREFTVERWPREQDDKWWDLMTAKHNDNVTCPLCGRRAELKNIGRAKRRTNLTSWENILYFWISDEGVECVACYGRKEYIESMRPAVELMPKARYQFRPGMAKMWKKQYAYIKGRWEYDWQQAKTVYDVFPPGLGYFGAYPGGANAVGLERLRRTFLRYHGYELFKEYCKGEDPTGWEQDRAYHWQLMTYLGAVTVRPELEMMLKMGLTDAVKVIVEAHQKGAGIDWSQKDPRKAFGLTTPELKEWISISGDLPALRLYKRSKKNGWKLSLTQTRNIIQLLGMEFFTRCGEVERPPLEVMKYLEKNVKERTNLYEVWTTWKDYLENAKKLGYELSVHNVLFPKNLRSAHDAAVGAVKYQQNKEKEERLKKRREALEKKYAFESEHFLIRPPRSIEEIIQEGKALRHCVGGYAERYAEGKTTILFLRGRENQEKPLCTIEMRSGKEPEIKQIHGYRNEWDPCPENPEQKKPEELYAEILEPWLEWLKAGSKRQKETSHEPAARTA